MNEHIADNFIPETLKHPQAVESRISGDLKILALLAITIWISYFWNSANFGLYSDDFVRIADAIDLNWTELQHLIMNLLLMQSGQGRPLHDISIYLFSFIGLRLGGLQVVYWIAYLILTINTFLFYTLLKRLFNKRIFALTGALAFCLFPAHTTQTWLTFTLGAQPSLIFLTLATLCYISGQKNLSYLLIFGSLISYETVFPVFLAVPLIGKKWNSRLMPELVKHALTLGAMIICLVLIRKITIGGAGVIQDLETHSTIYHSLQNQFYGPLISIKMLLYRPITALRALIGKDPYVDLLFFLPLCFAGLLWSLSHFNLAVQENTLRLKTIVDSKILKPQMVVYLNKLTKLTILGLIMLILAYPLTLTTSAFEVTSIGSRVHLAAAVGTSIICGSICSAILLLAGIYRRKRIATMCLALFFSLLIGFGLCVQRDYQLAWQYQRSFWSDVIKLIPDLNSKTILFLDTTKLKKNEYINALVNLHQESVLSKIYKFPDDWKEQPLYGFHLKPVWMNAYMLRPNWSKENIKLTGGNSFQLNPSIIGGFKADRTVDSSNIIFLEVKDRLLIRRTEPLIIDGQELPLKQKSASEPPPFEKGSLYSYLIKSPEEAPVNYIEN